MADQIRVLELKARLAEAELYRHKLFIGGGVVEFRDRNGEQVTYGRGSIGSLDAYIEKLKADILIEGGATPGQLADKFGPAGVSF